MADIVAGIKFIFKGKPYEVVAKTVYKLKGQWFDCIVYKTLYVESKNRPQGYIYVRIDLDFEWEQFVEAILHGYNEQLDLDKLTDNESNKEGSEITKA